MLKVIHIARPAQIGGTITSTLRQAQAEQDAGRAVRVWSLLQTQQDQFRSIAAKFTVPARQMTDIACMARLLAMRLRSTRNLLVHLHSGRASASPKVHLMRRVMPRRVPLVLSLHCTSELEAHDDPSWREQHLRYCADAAAIVVPSDRERQSQISYGLPPDKVFTVPDIVQAHRGQRGLLRRQLGLSEDARVVLYCGRVTGEKGPLRVIQAFASVKSRLPGCVLVVAGTGPQLEACEEAARPMRGSVFFLGHLADVSAAYADADVFVAPSTGESFGIAAMEAALAGIPMVLGRIRPWTDVFADRQHCVFVDPLNVSEISQAVVDLLTERVLAQSLRRNAMALVNERFTKERTMAALSGAYEFALRMCGSRSGPQLNAGELRPGRTGDRT